MKEKCGAWVKNKVIISIFRKVQFLWLSYRKRSLKRNMQKFYNRYTSDITEESDLILFWIPGGMSLLLHIEAAIAGALKLRGKRVHAIICDGLYKACIRREITDNIPIEEWASLCKSCKAECSSTLEQLGIEYSFVGDYVTPQEMKEAASAAKSAIWKSTKSIVFKGILVGINIQSAIYRYLRGADLPQNEQIVKEYTYSANIVTIAAQNAITRLKPKQVFMSHGIYVDWGPAMQVAVANDIPVTCYMGSYLPYRFYLRTLTDYQEIDFHNLTEDAWNKIKNQELTKAQSQRLDHYLDDRYQRDSSFDMKEFKPFVGDKFKKSAFLNTFGMDTTKPTVAILAHINWDAVSDYSSMLYDNFNDWIIDTIHTITNVTNVQWLLKVHPAEAWDNPDTGVEVLVKQHFPTLPDHIKVISATENINPLDFFSMIDAAVTCYGTSGLELALQGKAVILAGHAHYGRKGFTQDAYTIEEYHSLLQNVNSYNKLTIAQKELARRYAYCYFIQRQIPLAIVENPKSKWWEFQFNKKELLLPGRDPVIDFICDRIVDGDDFIMSDELAVATNTKFSDINYS